MFTYDTNVRLVVKNLRRASTHQLVIGKSFGLLFRTLYVRVLYLLALKAMRDLLIHIKAVRRP